MWVPRGHYRAGRAHGALLAQRDRVRVETWQNLRYLDKLFCVGSRAMHLVAAPAYICDLEPDALLLPSNPLSSAVTRLTCNRLAVVDRREGSAGLWLGASIALTRFDD